MWILKVYHRSDTECTVQKYWGHAWCVETLWVRFLAKRFLSGQQDRCASVDFRHAVNAESNTKKVRFQEKHTYKGFLAEVSDLIIKGFHHTL